MNHCKHCGMPMQGGIVDTLEGRLQHSCRKCYFEHEGIPDPNLLPDMSDIKAPSLEYEIARLKAELVELKKQFEYVIRTGCGSNMNTNIGIAKIALARLRNSMRKDQKPR